MEFGIGVGGPVGPEYKRVDESEKGRAATAKAKEVLERAGGYAVPEDWDVAQVDTEIAKLTREYYDHRQTMQSFTRRPDAHDAGNRDGAFQHEWAAEFAKLKIDILEKKKAELEGGSAPELPAVSPGNHDFVQALHQGLNGEAAEEPVGDLARAVQEGYEKGSQDGSEVDPLELGKVFQDNSSGEVPAESPQEL